MQLDAPGLRGRLFVVVQHMLPQHLITRLVYRLTRIRVRFIKDVTIRWFCWQFGVDTSEAEHHVPQGYAHFNDFFTRRLKPGLRPQPEDPLAIVSPCDGVISQSGRLEGVRLLQVKGRHYDARELLGGDATLARKFSDGAFLTVYLAPYDYHRVHMPIGGRLLRTSHLPGRLFSVNATTSARVQSLFARNERLVTIFATDRGPMAIVLVGALNVGTIGVVWQDEFRAGSRLPTTEIWADSQDAPTLARGDEMGWFNMGSTVITLLPPGAGEFSDGLRAGAKLHAGQSVGRLASRMQ